MLQNKLLKTKYFVALCVGILLIAGGVFFFLTRKPAQEEESPGIVEEEIPAISADNLGLTLETNANKNEVKFTIAKPDDIKSVSYELLYTAKTDDGSQQRAITGTIEAKSTSKAIGSGYIVLGTESSGVKKYDKGVTSVQIILKITKQDGKIFQSKKSLEL